MITTTLSKSDFSLYTPRAEGIEASTGIFYESTNPIPVSSTLMIITSQRPHLLETLTLGLKILT